MWHFLKDCENSTYSVERAVVYSADSFSAMCQSAPSSWRNTLGVSSSGDSKTESCPGSPCGTTFPLSTGIHGGTESMLCAEDSHARTFPQPDEGRGLMVLDPAFGAKCSASFVRFNPDTLSWKTAQCSLLGDLEEFSETWPRWGIGSLGGCSALTTPGLRTSAKESGFWPTVRASDGENGGRGDLIQAVRGNTNSHFRMYPTPTATNTNTKANHMRGADKGKKREPRSYGASGPLNPDWIEWLMGWPIKWTELGPSVTVRFQEWQRWHGQPSTAA